MIKNTCPKCDKTQVGKLSRKDENFKEDGNSHQYIYCWWCSTLLFYKVNGKIEWSLSSNVEKGLKYD